MVDAKALWRWKVKARGRDEVDVLGADRQRKLEIWRVSRDSFAAVTLYPFRMLSSNINHHHHFNISATIKRHME